MKFFCKTNFKSKGKFWKSGEEFLGDPTQDLIEHGMIEAALEPGEGEQLEDDNGETDPMLDLPPEDIQPDNASDVIEENLDQQEEDEGEHDAESEEIAAAESELQPPAGLSGKALKKWKKENGSR